MATYEPIRDIGLMEFLRQIPDESAATDYLVNQRWGDGLVCPRCGNDDQSKFKHQAKPMPYYCGGCQQYFSVRTGTAMQSSRLTLHKWLLAIYLITAHRKGISSLALAREIGVTQKTAWHLGHRIRTAFEQDGGMFGGSVEVDETYIGGKERNKHQDRKLNRGRGAVGKAAVAGAKDRESGNVKAEVIHSTGGKTLKGFVRRSADKGVKVYTDEFPSYMGLGEYLHETVSHSVSEYVRGMAHTNGIESFWALLKRGYNGIYHSMSRDHLPRYVDEFAGRYNMRQEGTMFKVDTVLSGLVGKCLPYAKLIGR